MDERHEEAPAPVGERKGGDKLKRLAHAAKCVGTSRVGDMRTRQIIHAMVLVLVTHTLGTGCATNDTLRVGSTQATPPPYVQCVAEFVELEADYPWFLNWVDPDGHERHIHGRSPRAIFRISLPSAYANRTVGILYVGEGEDLPSSPDVSQEGKRFSFGLPEGFFTNHCETIYSIHVKNMEKMP